MRTIAGQPSIPSSLGWWVARIQTPKAWCFAACSLAIIPNMMQVAWLQILMHLHARLCVREQRYTTSCVAMAQIATQNVERKLPKQRISITFNTIGTLQGVCSIHIELQLQNLWCAWLRLLSWYAKSFEMAEPAVWSTIARKQPGATQQHETQKKRYTRHTYNKTEYTKQSPLIMKQYLLQYLVCAPVLPCPVPI